MPTACSNSCKTMGRSARTSGEPPASSANVKPSVLRKMSASTMVQPAAED
jgi:hypothetical protein